MSSADSNYNNLANVPGVLVTVTQDVRSTLDLAVSETDNILEEGASTVLSATRSAGTGALTVSLATGGTADSTDYTLAAGIDIGSSDSSGTTSLAIADDSADERNETLTIATSALDATYQPGDTVTLTIVDQDPTSVVLARTGSGALAEGGADSAQLTVSLGRRMYADETVNCACHCFGDGHRGQ